MIQKLYLHIRTEPTIINGGRQPISTNTGNSILPDRAPKRPNIMAMAIISDL